GFALKRPALAAVGRAQDIAIDSQRPTLVRVYKPDRANLVLELIGHPVPRLSAVGRLQNLEALIRFKRIIGFFAGLLGLGFLVRVGVVARHLETPPAYAVDPANVLVDEVRAGE